MTFSEIPSRTKFDLSFQFRFGIEAEYMLARKSTGEPLWHDRLTFTQLNSILESIPLHGIPSLEGLELETPHRKLMPYVVEGYHLPNMDPSAEDVLPKGVEIRTPICSSVEDCVNVLGVLHGRLTEALGRADLLPVALSHHPVATKFSGPQNKRRHDFWLWAMEVMTTYGPDVNVSLPPSIADRVNPEDLEAKINWYGPALSALTVASPIFGGKLWECRGSVGRSHRMHRRSVIAPTIEFHPDERNRLEFKVFDMPNSQREFSAMILSFLALVLDDSLNGRETRAGRIYDLGQVARFGLEAEGVRDRAAELLLRAPATLEEWGFDPEPLGVFAERLEHRRTPADSIIASFRKGGIPEVIRSRTALL